MTDQHELPSCPTSPSTRPRSRAASWSTSSRRSRAATPPPAASSRARAAGAAGRGDRRRGGAADDLVHVGARAVGDDARPRTGRHRRRAVVHVHQHRAGVRPAGRPAGVLRHRAARPWASTRSTSRRCSTTPCARSWWCTTPASPATWRASARVLADWPDVRADRGQRPRPVRHAGATQPLGSLGRFAALSFHETKNFVCGEGGALLLNDAARRRPRAGALRQGHQPAGVPARPGRQVHLEGHRLVVRALRRARGVPARPARAARDDPGQAPRGPRALHARCSRRTPTSCDFALLRACRRTATRRTTCSTCCCPTATAATTVLESMRERGRARRRSTTCRCTAPTPAGGSRSAHDRVPGHRGHQRPAAAAAVLQQPHAADDLDRVVETFLASVAPPPATV